MCNPSNKKYKYILYLCSATSSTMIVLGLARTMMLCFCENETSRETKVSHGLARIVSAILHLRQIFRH